VTGGQPAIVVATTAAGGQVATGGTPASSDTENKKPDSGGGCAVGGWLSVRALGPWLLAGIFGAIVMLARRRRR
jgi:hypothetical protein